MADQGQLRVVQKPFTSPAYHLNTSWAKSTDGKTMRKGVHWSGRTRCCPRSQVFHAGRCRHSAGAAEKCSAAHPEPLQVPAVLPAAAGGSCGHARRRECPRRGGFTGGPSSGNLTRIPAWLVTSASTLAQKSALCGKVFGQHIEELLRYETIVEILLELTCWSDVEGHSSSSEPLI